MQKAPELPLRSDMSFCKKLIYKRKTSALKMQKAPELPLRSNMSFCKKLI